MRLIGLAVILTLSLTLAPLAAEAQATTKVPRIGVLWTLYSPVEDSPQALRGSTRSWDRMSPSSGYWIT